MRLMPDDSTPTEVAVGPLADLRIVDLSNSPAGAEASQTLADFGAEVVQIEPPGGSALRALPMFPLIGRGKKSMVLDLHVRTTSRSPAPWPTAPTC